MIVAPAPVLSRASARATAMIARLRFLRKCRDTDSRRLAPFVSQLAPTDHRGAINLLRRDDVQRARDLPFDHPPTDDTHAAWVPRLVGRRLDVLTLGAVLATIEARTWSDQMVLALAQGYVDADLLGGADHFARFVQAVAPSHPAGAARLSLAKAHLDPWSFLWQAEKLLAEGERTAVLAGLPAILDQPEGLLRARGLALIQHFRDPPVPAPPAAPVAHAPRTR